MTISEDMRNKVLYALNTHWRRHHMAPSMRELADVVGCNSTSVMKAALVELEAAGLIERRGEKGTARSYIPSWVVDLFRNAVCVYRIAEGDWALISGNVVSDGYETEQDARDEAWRRIFTGR